MEWISKDHLDTPRSVRVTETSRQSLLEDLTQRLKSGQGFCLATLNLDHVVKLRQVPAFHTAYAAHSHVTADGRPIVWFSRLAGHEVELIPGSELVEPVTAIAAEQGCSVALLGATEETLQKTAQALCARFPDLKIAAQIAPEMGFDPVGETADTYINRLRASGAQLCFIALGAPKQEIFAARAAAQLPQMGFLSIGAGLDFIAGTQTRAPVVVRKFAGEWLWRLLGNPRRLAARYAACIAIMPGLCQTAFVQRYKGGRGKA